MASNHTTLPERAVGIADNISVEHYNLSTIRRIEPRFDTLPRDSQQRALSYVEPETSQTTHNVTRDGLHRLVASLLNPSNDRANANDIVQLAVGDGATTTPDARVALNSEAGRVDVTKNDISTDTATLIVDAYLGPLTTDINSADDLTELALILADGTPANHAAFASPEPKSPNIALSISVRIPVADNS